MLQISRVLAYAGDQGRVVIERDYPLLDEAGGRRADAAPRSQELPPVSQLLVHRGGPAVIQAIDVAGLVALAAGAEAVVEVAWAVGDTVIDGMPLLRVHGGARPLDERSLRRLVNLGAERTFEQDPKYAMRILVDIAIKALSPAINDPTTAVQALDQLEDLLLRLGRRSLAAGRARDASGSVRLVVPGAELGGLPGAGARRDPLLRRELDPGHATDAGAAARPDEERSARAACRARALPGARRQRHSPRLRGRRATGKTRSSSDRQGLGLSPSSGSASAGTSGPRYPSLYQLNTRVFLTGLASSLGRRATLDDFPDAEIDRLAALGFDWVWLLSVWSTGKASRAGLAVVARAARGVRSDAAGPPGGRHRGLGLRDHRLLGAPGARRRRGARPAPRPPRRARPQADARLRSQPHGARPSLGGGPSGVLRGRDGAGPRARAAQLHVGETQARRPRAGLRTRPVLRGLAGHAAARLRESRDAGGDVGELAEDRAPVRRRALRHGDAGAAGGVRADLGPSAAEPFWPAAVARVRETGPGFLLMAEVYWDLEWTMQQQGFDYAYDKRLYDRLREGAARPVREHLQAGLDYQDRLARFLENHDEPRAAATFTPDAHRAAARHHVPVSRAALLPRRGSSRDAARRSRPTSCGRPWSPSTGSSLPSTTGCSACCGGRPCETAAGSCSSACRPGTATRAADRFRGLRLGAGRRAAARRGESSRRPRPVLRAPAVHGPGGPLVAAAGRARPGRLRPRRHRSCRRAGSTSTSRRGTPRSSR